MSAWFREMDKMYFKSVVPSILIAHFRFARFITKLTKIDEIMNRYEQFYTLLTEKSKKNNLSEILGSIHKSFQMNVVFINDICDQLVTREMVLLAATLRRLFRSFRYHFLFLLELVFTHIITTPKYTINVPVQGAGAQIMNSLFGNVKSSQQPTNSEGEQKLSAKCSPVRGRERGEKLLTVHGLEEYSPNQKPRVSPEKLESFFLSRPGNDGDSKDMEIRERVRVHEEVVRSLSNGAEIIANLKEESRIAERQLNEALANKVEYSFVNDKAKGYLNDLMSELVSQSRKFINVEENLVNSKLLRDHDLKEVFDMARATWIRKRQQGRRKKMNTRDIGIMANEFVHQEMLDFANKYYEELRQRHKKELEAEQRKQDDLLSDIKELRKTIGKLYETIDSNAATLKQEQLKTLTIRDELDSLKAKMLFAARELGYLQGEGMNKDKKLTEIKDMKYSLEEEVSRVQNKYTTILQSNIDLTAEIARLREELQSYYIKNSKARIVTNTVFNQNPQPKAIPQPQPPVNNEPIKPPPKPTGLPGLKKITRFTNTIPSDPEGAIFGVEGDVEQHAPGTAESNFHEEGGLNPSDFDASELLEMVDNELEAREVDKGDFRRELMDQTRLFVMNYIEEFLRNNTGSHSLLQGDGKNFELEGFLLQRRDFKKTEKPRSKVPLKIIRVKPSQSLGQISLTHRARNSDDSLMKPLKMLKNITGGGALHTEGDEDHAPKKDETEMNEMIHEIYQNMTKRENIRFIKKLFYDAKGIKPPQRTREIEVTEEEFAVYFRQFLVVHQRCGDECIHIKRFLDRVGYTNPAYAGRVVYHMSKPKITKIPKNRIVSPTEVTSGLFYSHNRDDIPPEISLRKIKMLPRFPERENSHILKRQPSITDRNKGQYINVFHIPQTEGSLLDSSTNDKGVKSYIQSNTHERSVSVHIPNSKPNEHRIKKNLE